MTLGLARGTLSVVPYCDEWAGYYRIEEAALKPLIGFYIDDLQHVGSTSLTFQGMVAKPIIDMAARISDLQKIESCVPILEGAGYWYKGENGIADRHLFAKGKSIVTHHLHMMLPGCTNWEKQINFRDYLLANPDQAKAYALLKKRLYAASKGDRKAYQAGKKDFIEAILIKAKS